MNGSVAKEWALNNRKYYGNVTQPIYVTEMNIGKESFLDMLAKYPNIELVTKTGTLIRESLKKNGTRIVELTTRNDQRTWKASVWMPDVKSSRHDNINIGRCHERMRAELD